MLNFRGVLLSLGGFCSFPEPYEGSDLSFLSCMKDTISESESLRPSVFWEKSHIDDVFFSTNSVVNTWGSYGNGKRPGC